MTSTGIKSFLAFSGGRESVVLEHHSANAVQAAFTRSPTMAELKDILQSERAVLMTQEWFDGIPEIHAMPWIDGMAYDCRPPVEARYYEQLSVVAAMVIRPAQPFQTPINASEGNCG